MRNLSRPVRWALILATVAGAVAVVALVASTRTVASSGSSSSVCEPSETSDRTHHVTLEGPAYDVRMHPSGGYVVATSGGVLHVDACELDVVARCSDTGGALRLHVSEDGQIHYLRRDQSVARCDLARSEVHASDMDAAGLEAARSASAGPGLSVRGDRAWFQRPGAPPHPLRESEGALGIAVSPDGGQIAVAHRTGVVSLYTRAGLPQAQYRPHSRNAYSVVFDGAQGRMVTVGGTGELALRAWPLSVRER